MRPQTYTSPAIGFAQRGFAAVIVMRRGYGHSTGVFSDTLGPCNDRNYIRAGHTAAVDVLAALADLRQESWVDPTRVILVGHSMGGFAVLAAVADDPPDGVLGVISFAGAVGSPRPDFICQPDRLIEADRIFGLTSRIPSLWIFAENDHYFGPELARSLWDAYVSNAAPASLFVAPSFGKDGHLLIFAADQTVWWPSVSAFLENCVCRRKFRSRCHHSHIWPPLSRWTRKDAQRLRHTNYLVATRSRLPWITLVISVWHLASVTR